MSTPETPAATTLSAKSLEIGCPLTQDNYPLWKFKMLPMLDDENLATIVVDEQNGEIVTFVATPRAMRALTLNISNDLSTKITHLKTAQQIWDYFGSYFSGVSYSRKHIGIQKVCAFRHQKQSIRDSIADLRNILNDIIISAGTKTITFEELAIAMLLNSLPAVYAAQRSILTASGEKDLDKVQAALVKEEEVINAAAAHEQQFAGAAFGKTPTAGSHRTWPAGTTVCKHNWNAATCNRCDPEKMSKRQKRINELIKAICIDCGKVGHKSKGSDRCPKYDGKADVAGLAGAAFETNGDEDLVPFKSDMALVASTEERTYKRQRRASLNPGDLRFILDSGCSTSLSKNKANLKHYSTVYSEIQVADSTAPKLRCEGNGELDITSNLSIKNVLYSPNVALNLLSVAQIADLNCRIIFDKVGCKVEHIPTGRVLLTGKREGNLYVYTRTAHGHAFLTSEAPPSKMELFHRRMGHINYRDLRQLARLADGVTLEKSPTSECTHCIQAKSHRRHFSSSTSHANALGNLLILMFVMLAFQRSMVTLQCLFYLLMMPLVSLPSICCVQNPMLLLLLLITTRRCSISLENTAKG